MKIIVLAFALLGSTHAFAADPSVEVTSFLYERAPSRVAELCGKVSDLVSETALVRITVDESSKRPGIYYSMVEATQGKFCVVVVSHNGTAIVELPKLSKKIFATVISN